MAALGCPSRAKLGNYYVHRSKGSALAPGNGPDNDKRLLPRRDRFGQWGVRRFVGQILLAGEEAQEWSTLLRDLVANRPAQHRKACLERVEDRSQRDRAVELKFYFAADVRERSEMLRDYDSDHFGIPLRLK
jgi:hypothetical protein